MDDKLLEILKKAKAVDERAKQYDSIDKSVLESNINSKKVNNTVNESFLNQIPTTDTGLTQQNKQLPNVDVDSDEYKQRVKGSKLPPEIQKLMLETPIPQSDYPGTFSMSEEMIKKVNPNYNQPINEIQNNSLETNTNQQTQVGGKPTQQVIDRRVIKKMIAEEISRALPSIVEKYFDKKLIQENVKALNALKRRQ